MGLGDHKTGTFSNRTKSTRFNGGWASLIGFPLGFSDIGTVINNGDCSIGTVRSSVNRSFFLSSTKENWTTLENQSSRRVAGRGRDDGR
jgi:hypothetical protein